MAKRRNLILLIITTLALTACGYADKNASANADTENQKESIQYEKSVTVDETSGNDSFSDSIDVE